MKQETLEEAAENYSKTFIEDDGTAEVDFIAGAKWQQDMADKIFNLDDVNKIINLAYVSGGGNDTYQECIDFVYEQMDIKSLNKQDNMKEFLINLNACNDAKEWAEDKTWEEVYNTCHRGDWLLWLFKKTNPDDLQLITLAKGHCANTIRHLMTDERSIAGVDAAIVFGEGKSTREELSGAAAAAYAAAYAAASDAAGAAAASAYAAGAGADAKNKNMELTADICRKYLPIDVWNVKSLNKQD